MACLDAVADPENAVELFLENGWNPSRSEVERLAALIAMFDLSQLYLPLMYGELSEGTMAQLLDRTLTRAERFVSDETVVTFGQGAARAIWSVTERPDHNLNHCVIAAPQMPTVAELMEEHRPGEWNPSAATAILPLTLARENVEARFVRLNFDNDPPRPVTGLIGIIATSRTPFAAATDR